MIRITVDTEEQKQELLQAIHHIHGADINTDIPMVNELVHLYHNSDLISVLNPYNEPKSANVTELDNGDIIRKIAAKAGIEMSGGFAVVAECVTLDELRRFADIVINEHKNSVKENYDWQAVAGDLTLSIDLLRQENEKIKNLIVLAKVQGSRKDCNDILEGVLDGVYVDIDHFVAKDLREAHERLIVPDRDEGGIDIEPDYKIIEALELVLSYYMSKNKFDEWFSKVQVDKLQLWSDFDGKYK